MELWLGELNKHYKEALHIRSLALGATNIGLEEKNGIKKELGRKERREEI